MEENISPFYDILKGHLNSILAKRDNLYYLGTLSRSSSQDSPSMRRIIIKRPGKTGQIRHGGYLTSDKSKRMDSVSYVLPFETVHFNFSAGKFNLKIQEPQVTRHPSIMPQFLTKTDWVTPNGLEINLEGDYSMHQRIISDSIEIFDSTGSADLVLPSLFFPFG